MIECDKVDLLTCFESEPELEQGGLGLHYVTERAGYQLYFSLWPYDEDVHIVLKGPSQTLPLVEAWLHDCTAIRYANEAGKESLSFLFRASERGRGPKERVTALFVRPEFSLVVTG